MNYSFSGSSNSVTPNKPVNLEIIISRESGDLMKLKGQFVIENLQSVIAGTKWSDLKCDLYGKNRDVAGHTTTPTKIVSMVVPAVPGNVSSILARGVTMEYAYIIVKIYNALPDANITSRDLRLRFYDEATDIMQDISFTVVKKQSEFSIKEFKATPTVIQGGSSTPVRFSWSIAGEGYEYAIYDDLNAIRRANGTGPDVGSFEYDRVSIGDHVFTLLAKADNITLKESVAIRALDRSACFRVNNAGPDDVVANICVANDASAVFSLVVDRSVSKVSYVGYSPDGFSGLWTKLLLTEADISLLKPYVFTPMMHLRTVGQAFGKLFLVGGSSIEAKKCSNIVAIIDLDLANDRSVNRVRLQQCSWPARMGHSCVLFPHFETEKIWMMGGQDEWGATLNDIWVSENGIDWANIDKNGAVTAAGAAPAPMDWAPRCHFGAAARADEHGKQALWIGGGLSEEGGKETPDVWIWDKKNWSQVKSRIDDNDIVVKINNGSYRSSAVAFVGRTTNDSTGMYLFGYSSSGGENSTYFSSVSNSRKNYYETNKLPPGLEGLSTSGNAGIISLFFKGCMWYIVISNQGDSGISVSYLYYWVPPVGDYSIVLS